MILGLGLFVVGLAVLVVIGFLVGVALDGEVEVGLILAGIIPLIAGIYHIGKFIATQFDWIY